MKNALVAVIVVLFLVGGFLAGRPQCRNGDKCYVCYAGNLVFVQHKLATAIYRCPQCGTRQVARAESAGMVDLVKSSLGHWSIKSGNTSK